MPRIIETKFPFHAEVVRIVLSEDFEDSADVGMHFIDDLKSHYRDLIADIASLLIEDLASHDWIGESRERVHGLPVISVDELWELVRLEHAEIFSGGEIHLHYVAKSEFDLGMVVYVEDWEVVGGQAR